MGNKSAASNCEMSSSFTGDSASLTWVIKGVAVNCLNFHNVITSPKFTSSDAKWVLDFDATDKNRDQTCYIRLRLLASDCEKKRVRCSISYLSKPASCNPFSSFFGSTDTSTTGDLHDFKVGDSFIVGTIVWFGILGKKEEQLPDDTLTIFCELRAETKPRHNILTRSGKREPIPVHPTDDTSVDKLVADFKNVFEKKKYCDVVLLSSDGQKFPAHKAILEERSSVFAVMFQHDMAESRDGEVRIEDVDGSTLKHLLQYMYTARIDEIPVGVVSRLYVAADKYNMESLKKLCIRQMMANISVDNVCDAIVLADLFKEERLK